MYKITLFLSLYYSQLAQADDSFILFEPVGSKVRSQLITQNISPADIKAPNYFSADAESSLLKTLIEAELKDAVQPTVNTPTPDKKQ